MLLLVLISAKNLLILCLPICWSEFCTYVCVCSVLPPQLAYKIPKDKWSVS